MLVEIEYTDHFWHPALHLQNESSKCVQFTHVTYADASDRNGKFVRPTEYQLVLVSMLRCHGPRPIRESKLLDRALGALGPSLPSHRCRAQTRAVLDPFEVQVNVRMATPLSNAVHLTFQLTASQAAGSLCFAT